MRKTNHNSISTIGFAKASYLDSFEHIHAKLQNNYKTLCLENVANVCYCTAQFNNKEQQCYCQHKRHQFHPSHHFKKFPGQPNSCSYFETEYQTTDIPVEAAAARAGNETKEKSSLLV